MNDFPEPKPSPIWRIVLYALLASPVVIGMVDSIFFPMQGNPVIVDLLLNILGFVIVFRVSDPLYYRTQKNKGFAVSVGLVFLCAFYYIAARYLHMNYYISLRSVSWQHANFYLFWGSVATISAVYFYIAKKATGQSPHQHAKPLARTGGISPLHALLSYREKRRLRRSFGKPFVAGTGRGEYVYYENGRSVQMDTELMRGPNQIRIYLHDLKWKDNGEILTATKHAEVLTKLCEYFDKHKLTHAFYSPEERT